MLFLDDGAIAESRIERNHCIFGMNVNMNFLYLWLRQERILNFKILFLDYNFVLKDSFRISIGVNYYT